jgi:HK97 family phage portal protein
VSKPRFRIGSDGRNLRALMPVEGIKAPGNLLAPSYGGLGSYGTIGNEGWFSIVHEPYTGAWQSNKELRRETVLTYSAVYACVTLIASDIAKIRCRLVEEDDDGIWTETKSAAFSPVLRKPNRYQNRIKFFEQWVVSRLLHGNTYVLLERDERKVVVAMYILDPMRTKPLVTPDGAVYYQLSADNLAGIQENSIVVPASEIIHDTCVPLYHPLCGVSPLTACGLAASQGLNIQQNSAAFFRNGSQPSGILTAPGNISNDDAARLKAHWEEKYTGVNAGKVAVVGSGLKYEAMTISAVDAQLIEQLKWSGETVASCFHVPAYMIGIGDPPSYNNIQALNQQYYSQCLQVIFESIELCLDEGLGLVNVVGHSYGSEFDLDDLLRMDTATLVDTEVKAIKGLKEVNEARKRLNLRPTVGGNAVYMQEQNYSLEALAKRDALENPFGAKSPSTPAASTSTAPANDNVEVAAQVAYWKLKSLLTA